MYEEAEIYPMHGESCNNFYRECEYFGLCNLPTQTITEALTDEEEVEIVRRNTEDFQITLHLNDLILSQLSKALSEWITNYDYRTIQNTKG
jgi:hypothetical protein